MSMDLMVVVCQSMDDQCPVCKSDRYLNPKLRLLVSACYHKMYALQSGMAYNGSLRI